MKIKEVYRSRQRIAQKASLYGILRDAAQPAATGAAAFTVITSQKKRKTLSETVDVPSSQVEETPSGTDPSSVSGLCLSSNSSLNSSQISQGPTRKMGRLRTFTVKEPGQQTLISMLNAMTTRAGTELAEAVASFAAQVGEQSEPEQLALGPTQIALTQPNIEDITMSEESSL